MSWGCTTERKCESCGYETEVEESTLIINSPSYGKCPKCGGELIIKENRSMAEFMDGISEKLRKRKKENHLS